ncbi:uncharacterized protein EV420DRAFT_1764085 [Desarmillaria tabescens]|uniref:Uncharacterized protein n=1 Tax=Armillaria tabescens TaxID=1929756 RepID=A0AA39N5P9_ARMTA|nr:uncharacterized protein EV420DRAFT_1764085 [Desarmillaria tabescens]KAK0458418.1 hypothetical protein EV420DRAFT_1764085 [Desarmillaria tabescens]
MFSFFIFSMYSRSISRLGIAMDVAMVCSIPYMRVFLSSLSQILYRSRLSPFQLASTLQSISIRLSSRCEMRLGYPSRTGLAVGRTERVMLLSVCSSDVVLYILIAKKSSPTKPNGTLW